MNNKIDEKLVLRKNKENGVLILTLNRHNKLNALSIPLLQQLSKHLEFAENNTDIRCVIITGAGKTFSAGADINDMFNRGVGAYADKNRLSAWGAIEQFSKPLIAAVNGYALGGGLELALICDIIIASNTAKFGSPEINIGGFPGDGGTQRLPRIVGKSLAMQMVLTGMTIDAHTAEKTGLISEITRPENLLQRSIEIGNEIAKKSSAIIPLAKIPVSDLDADQALNYILDFIEAGWRADSRLGKVKWDISDC